MALEQTVPLQTFQPEDPNVATLRAAQASDALAIARQRIQSAQDNAAVQAAMQQSGGDPDAAIKALQATNPRAAYGFSALVTKQRHDNLQQAIDESEFLTKKTDSALKLFQGVGNDPKQYQIALDGAAAMLGDTPAGKSIAALPRDATPDQIPGIVQNVINQGLSAKDYHQQITEGLTKWLGNDPTAGLAHMLEATDDPQTRAGIISFAQAHGMPDEVLAAAMSLNNQVAAGADPKTFRKLLGPEKPVEVPEGGSLVIPSTGEVVFQGQSKPKDEFQTFKDAYAKQILGPTGKWEDLTPKQQIDGNSQFTISKQDPSMVALSQSNAQIRNLLMQAQLGQQPTKDDAALIAKQIVDHKMAPSQVQLFGGFGAQGAAFKRMVGTEALKLDPNFDWEQAESDYQYGKSPVLQGTIRYMDETTQSIPRLTATADQLGNSNIRFFNGLANLSKNQLNNPTLKKFQVDALAVADGVAKVLQGGGSGSGTTDAKLEQAQQIIRTSDSPAAVKAAMEEVQELFKIRRGALTRGTYLERVPAGGGGPQTYSGEVRKTTDGRFLGLVNGKPVELTKSGSDWVIK